MSDLHFDFSVNHIIKNKNGECLYILKTLTKTTANCIDPATFKSKFKPILFFVHATRKDTYSKDGY